jgi:hypothetical protein
MLGGGIAVTAALGVMGVVMVGYLSRPPLPVEVDWRSSYLGEGLVLVLTNKSERHLTILLDVTNPTTAASSQFELHLRPMMTDEFGWLEGWRFTSGDRVRIQSSGYSSRRLRAP